MKPTPKHSLLILFTTLVLGTPSLFSQGGGSVQAEYTAPPVPVGPNVNEFTGDFTYGIPILSVPGPYGSGYGLVLSYRAGADPNGEVSWVGYGWSLNPGAIVRQKRGFPDDWEGKVVYHNRAPVNYTVSAAYTGNLELGSADKEESEEEEEGSGEESEEEALISKLKGKVGASYTQQYSNLTGFAKTWGLTGGASFLGNYAGMNYMNTNGKGSFDPVLSINLWMTGAEALGGIGKSKENKKANFWHNSAKKTLNGILALGASSNLFSSRELNLQTPTVTGLQGNSANYGFKFGWSFTSGVINGVEAGAAGNVAEYYTVPFKEFDAYGYLRSHETDGKPKSLMDYYLEKDIPYTLNDKFLPIPFSNADVFNVVGGGSFRAYNRGVGRFRQNSVSSSIDVDNIEFAVDGGASWGIGTRWGEGDVVYTAEDWEGSSGTNGFIGEGDEPYFFRFSHDVGGSVEYAPDDNAVQADIAWLTNGGSFGEGPTSGKGAGRWTPVLDSSITLQKKAWQRPGRSEFIGYTLNVNILDQRNDRYYRSYNKDSNVFQWVQSRSDMPEGIGEFALFGSGHSLKVYGLPVYARNEKEIQLGLENIKIDDATDVKSNFLAYRNVDASSASTVIGKEMDEPYAVAWLLTETTTPDYVDLTANGPSDDDLGGWTKFYWQPSGFGTFDKVRSSSDSWFSWRAPYNGLSYQIGDLSDPKDDLGTYSSGEREQYYLSRIETKTHVALFVTSPSYGADVRKDAYQQAQASEADIASDSTRSRAEYDTNGIPNSNLSRHLDRIELYTKDSTGNPEFLISTTHFEYDYSLRKNMPNALPVHPDSTTRNGMLTLRKVWTERHGIEEATITPYTFGYEYKKSTDYAAPVVAKYPEVVGFADSLAAEDQNPDYAPFDFDRWGYYQRNGAERYARLNPWVCQTDDPSFDPAAWQLKTVRTPTGAENHIQYEQDDYAFVHDRPAMAMVSIKESVASGWQYASNDQSSVNQYYLNLSDIGVDSSDYTQVTKVMELIEKHAEKQKKFFFRFLYALKGETASITNPEYNSDYVEGYANLFKVALDTLNTGMSNEWYALYIRLIGDDDHGVPKQVCWDYVDNRKRGKLGPTEAIPYSSHSGMIWHLLGLPGVGFDESNHCKDIDYANSYIRIPMITAKKGGGLRVKRLLMYDHGIEGDSALYGTEYHYEIYDQERNEVISSGVAANEPVVGRSENALIDVMVREADADLDEKVIANRDRARNEGPIGESLLPGASVGYGRIVKHTIHQGKTTSGFAVTDYYTYRDFPFDVQYQEAGNAVDYTDIKDKSYRTPAPLESFLVARLSENKVRATQGYRFLLSDIHGKLRRVQTNGGIYTPYQEDWVTGSMIEYLYYPYGDSLPLLYHVGDSLRYGNPGKEMEIIQASRDNRATIDDWKIEGDVGFWFLSGRPYVALTKSELKTHVTTKVIRYPTMLKSILAYSDGQYNYSENLAFDPRSGAPLLSRGYDGFSGLTLAGGSGEHSGAYHYYGLLSENVYPEIGRIADNERKIMQSTQDFSIQKGSDGNGTFLQFPGGSQANYLRALFPGDLVELTLTVPVNGVSAAGLYHVDNVDGNVVRLMPSGHYNAPADSTMLSQTGEVHVEIVRSGRANSHGSVIGSIVTYGEDPDDVAAAKNFSWGGAAHINKRQGFVNQLNSALGADSGTFNSTNVHSSLQFKRIPSGTCASLGSLPETFTLSVYGDTVLIASTNYTDTLVDCGSGGYFRLDNAGQVVYQGVGDYSYAQPVTNLIFCGDSVTYRTTQNVISASAGLLNDTIDWDGGGVAYTPNQKNAYEKGERGRWSSRTAYLYRTSVGRSSHPVAGERIYKDAGVFDDFSLFNAKIPSESDWAHWIRLDSITHINKHNVAYGVIDRLDRSSVTLFDYGPQRDLLPVLSAWNAERGSVGFESFEVFNDGDMNGELSVEKGHAGSQSILIDGQTTSNYTMEIIINNHLLQKGGLVQFWSTHDGGDIALLYASPSAEEIIPVRIARTGEWVLYKAVLSKDSVDHYFDLSDTMSLSFNNIGTDPLWIDDVKFQPTDAGTKAHVYDKTTLRPVGSLDNQGFGLYPGYDSRGKIVRSVIETARGTTTIADVYAHIPAITRTWSGEGSPYGTIPSNNPTGIYSGDAIGNNRANPVGVNLLNVELGLSKGKVELLGLNPVELRNKVREHLGNSSELLPAQLEAVDQYEKLYNQQKALKAELQGDLSNEKRAQIETDLKALQTEQQSLLQQLNTNE